MSLVLSNVVREIRSFDSVGGNQIRLSEARNLLGQAKADQVIDASERDVLKAVLRAGELTSKAEALLRSALRPSDGHVVSDDRSPLGPQSLTINPAGKLSFDGIQGEDAWEALAEQVAAAHRQGDTRYLRAVPMQTKEAVLRSAMEQLDAVDRVDRSAAFTVLYAMSSSLPKSSAFTPLFREAHSAMLETAQDEANPRLGKHMTRLLMDKGYQRRLSSTEKAETNAVFEARFPQRFDVHGILDADGYVQWEHSIEEGENMFRSFRLNVQKTPIGGSRFEIVDEGHDFVDFEVTFKKPRGENGEVKGVRLRARKFHNDMFDRVGEPVGISYGGHSGMGNNQERSIADAMKKGRFAEKPQLIFLDLCAGQDGLDDAMEKLGNVEVITTLDSSRYGMAHLKDEEGSFYGIGNSEMQPGLFAVLESLTRGEDYSEMRSRAKRGMFEGMHVYDTNYISGNLKDYRNIRWAHMDGDDDGVADAIDLHFRFGSVDPRSTKSLKLIHDMDVATLNGDKVRDAALDLNVCTHYHGLMEGNEWAEHVFTSGGYFEDYSGEELVRFETVKGPNGKDFVSVSINAGLAHASRETLGALVHYEAIHFLMDDGRIEETTAEERELLALVFAAARLGSDANKLRGDRVIWRELLKRAELPTDIPLDGLAKRLLEEKGDFCGNLKIARGFGRSLSVEHRKAIKAAVA